MKLNNSVRKRLIILCILICLAVVISFFLPKTVHAPGINKPVYENKDPRPTGNTRRLSEPTIAIQKLANNGSMIDGQLGVGTFISSNGFLLTAKHVIESGVHGVGVIDNDYTIINEHIALHPTQDLALMQLYNVTTACTTISTYEGDSAPIQEITHPTTITPGMSGTPLYTNKGSLEGIIVQRDQNNTKKGQGLFISPSLLSRIEAHVSLDTTESCKNNSSTR